MEVSFFNPHTQLRYSKAYGQKLKRQRKENILTFAVKFSSNRILLDLMET